ncbi:hypothetical protein VZQ01_37240 [Myxococcus faecalis]|uniref:hypothetical protein n=1 Tax=Myxococcus faecalis TaxID=3115646 RepID=UPI003CE8F30A
MALTLLATTPGCSGGSDGGHRNYRVLTHEKSAPRTFAEYRERTGSYKLAFDDREARDVSYYLRSYVTRGDGDVVLGLADAYGDASFTVNDATSTVTIQSAGGTDHLVINADESVSVNGLQFPNGGAAGIYLDSNSSAVGAISDESIGVVHEEVGTELGYYEDNSRGGVVVAIVAVTWLVSTAVLCRREYRRKNRRLDQMTLYCRNWCTQTGGCY